MFQSIFLCWMYGNYFIAIITMHFDSFNEWGNSFLFVH